MYNHEMIFIALLLAADQVEVVKVEEPEPMTFELEALEPIGYPSFLLEESEFSFITSKRKRSKKIIHERLLPVSSKKVHNPFNHLTAFY